MKRYAILVVQYGSKRESELCQVDSNPHEVAKAVAEKRLRVRWGDKWSYVPKYDAVRVVDNEADPHERSSSHSGTVGD